VLYWLAFSGGAGLLGVVFAISVYRKLKGYERFKSSLSDYQLFPPSLLGLAAPGVIGLEIAAIAAIVAPVGPGLWIAFALLSLYTLAMMINMTRDRAAIDCGCGDQPTQISGWLLARNGALMLLALPHSPPGFVPDTGAWLLLGVVVAVLSGLYLLLERFLSRRSLNVRADDSLESQQVIRQEED
jgi:hypothetical protein